jgi:hypothetical protein
VICQSLFTPDDEYDRNHASDGASRYGAYLAQYAALFNDDDQPTADAGRFAGAAWRIALPPVMAPGYVRAHGRVQHTQFRWDEDQRQAVCADLAVSSAPEAAELVRPWRRWTRDEHGRWHGPDDYAHPVALTVLRIAVPLTNIPLPDPCYCAGLPDTRTAKLAVRAICVTVNAALQSVVAFDPLAGSPR